MNMETEVNSWDSRQINQRERTGKYVATTKKQTGIISKNFLFCTWNNAWNDTFHAWIHEVMPETIYRVDLTLRKWNASAQVFLVN